MKAKILFIAILVSFFCMSCEKYLDIKPDKKLSVPSSNLQNLRLLLDDDYVMNRSLPAAGETASDNVYISDSRFDAVMQVSVTSANAYTWQRNVFNDSERNDWGASYAAILRTNLTLEGADKITPSKSEQDEWNRIKGSALFFRSHAFYALLQVVAKAYNKSTAEQDPGIVLKLNSDINERSKRSSVQQCYEQILKDLNEAVTLLPVSSKFKTEPSQTAAYAMLARAHLSMGNFTGALENAEKALQLYPTLIDYNTLNPASSYPFVRYNEEVIFHGTITAIRGVLYPYTWVDEKLYAEYDNNDLRKSLFFKDNGAAGIQFRGSYDGGSTPFGGIASDELYLIAAECAARTDDKEKAMNLLNQLLSKRFLETEFVPLQAATSQEALDIILAERRKELLFRNLRWGDLKRLNAESRYQTTIERVSNGITYTLHPDNWYVFPIPEIVIEMSGMEQN